MATTPQTTYFGDVVTQGNTLIAGTLTEQGTFAYFKSNIGCVNQSTSIGSATVPFGELYGTTANITSVTLTTIVSNVGIGTGVTANAISLLGNMYASDSVGAMNIFSPIINTSILNVLSIFTQNSFLGIGTTNPSGTSLWVPGNAYVSTSFTTGSVSINTMNTTTGNITSLWVTSNVGIGTRPGGTPLIIQGNFYSSNSVTTGGVNASTSANIGSLNVSSIFNQNSGAGMSINIGTASGTGLYVQGSALISDTIQTINIYAPIMNTYGIINAFTLYDTSNAGIGTTPVIGGPVLSVQGNVYVSNTLTTPQIYTGTLTSPGLSNIVQITATSNLIIGSITGATLTVDGNVFISNILTTPTVLANVSNVASLGVTRIDGPVGINQTATGNALSITGDALFTTRFITTNVLSQGFQSDTLQATSLVTNSIGNTSNALDITGSASISDGFQTKNIFATTATTTSLNVLSIFGKNGYIGIEGDPDFYAQIALQGGVNASNAIQTTSIYASTSNIGNLTRTKTSLMYSVTIGQPTLFPYPFWEPVNTNASSGITWNSITYDSTTQLFLAVGQDNGATSYDGTGWTASSIPTGVKWTGVVSGAPSYASTFVAVGTGAAAITTDGGRSWSPSSINPSVSWRSITFDSSLGYFVAVGQGAAALSTDGGVNFLDKTIDNGITWNSVTAGPKVQTFVAVGNGAIAISTDGGSSWNTTYTNLTINWTGVTWSQPLGYFVAVSQGGVIGVSTDGLIWVFSYTIVSLASVTGSDDNRVVAVGPGGGVVSTDGTNWTTTDLSFDIDWTGVSYSPDLGVFVAVAGDGLTSSQTQGTATTWTNYNRTTSFAVVVWSPELQLFVAAGQLGGSATSADGSIWTPNNLDPGGDWSSIAWSSELQVFAAVSLEHTDVIGSATSSDGINWINGFLDPTHDWFSVAWSPDQLVFVTVGGEVSATSTDGINWRMSNIDAGIIWKTVTWSPSLQLFIATGTNGRNLASATSVDGVDWTLNVDGNLSFSFNSVVWSPGTLVSVGTGVSAVSQDGLNWQPTSIDPSINWNSVTWSEPGYFVAVGPNATSISIDGTTWFPVTTGFPLNFNSIAWASSLGIFVGVGNQASLTGPNAAISIFSSLDYSFILGAYTGFYVYGNAYVSGTTQTGTIFGTNSNTTSLNVLSIYSQNSFMGIGTTNPSGTSLYVDGNVYLSKELQLTTLTGLTASFSNTVTVNGSLNTNLSLSVAIDPFWSSSGIDPTKIWNSVIWYPHNNSFIAVGGLDASATSTDGVTWTNRDIGINKISWKSVTASDNLLVAVAPGASASSLNGVTWTSTSIDPGIVWNGVTFQPGGNFVAVGGGSAISPDGASWVNTNLIKKNPWNSVTTSQTLLVAVGLGIATSSDGINWDYPTLSFIINLKSVTYSLDLNMLVAVGEDGAGRGASVTSLDGGGSWTLGYIDSETGWTSVTWSSDLGIFIAGRSGDLSFNSSISQDGVNWFPLNPGLVMNFNALTWSPYLGIFVGVGTPNFPNVNASVTGKLPKQLSLSILLNYYALLVKGNAYVSNSVQTTNIVGTKANTTSLNVVSIFSQNSFLGIGTTNPSGTSLYVAGNVFSLSLNASSIFGTSANISSISNTNSLMTGKIGTTGNTLSITGNAYMSNALQTINIYSTNATVSRISNITNINSFLKSNIIFTGNAFVSNSIKTTNVLTTTMNIYGQMNTSSLIIQYIGINFPLPWAYLPMQTSFNEATGQKNIGPNSSPLTYIPKPGPGTTNSFYAGGVYVVWPILKTVYIDPGFTISIWANTTDVTNLLITDINGNLFSLYVDGGGYYFTYNGVNIYSYGSRNAWDHICATVINGTMRLYVNGTQIAQGSYTPNSSITIGPGSNMYIRSATGFTDVRLFSLALSLSQANILYKTGGLSTPAPTQIFGNVYTSNVNFSIGNVFATNANVTTLNIASLPSLVGIGQSYGGASLSVTGNVYISNAINVTNLIVTTMNSVTINTASITASILTTPSLGFSVSNINISNSITTGTIYYTEDFTKRSPHLLPTPSNAAAIQTWVAATASQTTRSWWDTSSMPLYANVSGPTGGAAYTGGVYLPDGRVVFVPTGTSSIGIYNPQTLSFTSVSGASPDFGGGVLLPTGNVLFVPQTSNIGQLNPLISQFSNILAIPGGSYSGSLTANNVIFAPQGTPSNIINYNFTSGTISNVLALPSANNSGKSWTGSISGLNFDYTSWNAFAWSPQLGLFVATGGADPSKGGGSGVNSAYSRDGISWTASPSGTSLGSIDSTWWYGVAWSPQLGLFAACGYNGRGSAYSRDGINWTASPSATSLGAIGDYYAQAIAWSPKLGLFVAGGYHGYAYSNDGINWTFAQNIGSTQTAVAWSPQLGLFAACGAYSTNSVWSTDGINWNNTSPNPLSSIGSEWYGIDWSPQLGLFTACGNTGVCSAYSKDGINWYPSPSATSLSSQMGGAGSVAWSPQLGMFVACGWTDNGPNSAWSKDGINWYPSPLASSLYSVQSNYTHWKAVAWSPQLGRFVACGWFGNSAYSTGPFSIQQGVCLLTNGNVIVPSPGTSNVIQFNPVSLGASNIVVGTDGFNGLVLAPNGNVIGVPQNSNVIVINPTAGTSSNVQTPVVSFNGGCLLPSGFIMFSSASSSIGMFDPGAALAYSISSVTGSSFNGATLVPSGQVILTPYNSANVGVLDTFTPVSQEFCLSPYFNKF